MDEIQKAAELFDYIKDIVDTNKVKGQFYLSGSQSLRLMKNDVLNIQDESAFIKFVKATASLTGEMLNLSTMAEICGLEIFR